MKKIFYYSFSLILLLLSSTIEAQSYSSAQRSRSAEEAQQRREAEKKAAEKAQKKLRRDSIPLFGGITLGTDLIAPGSYLLKREKLSFQVSAEVNLKNRYYPIVELGTSRMNLTSEDDYNFKSKNAFYSRVGLNYAFQQRPDFYFYGGIRYGFSHVSYDILGIPIVGDYWGESQRVDILDQKSFSQWASIVAGIKVKIYKGFSMGWNVRYNFLISSTKNANSNTWFIPGYGMNQAGSSSSTAVEYNIYYQLPFRGKK
ncbi:MAG: DUF6048 family protein [Bacteroidales bacterium]